MKTKFTVQHEIAVEVNKLVDFSSYYRNHPLDESLNEEAERRAGELQDLNLGALIMDSFLDISDAQLVGIAAKHPGAR